MTVPVWVEQTNGKFTASLVAAPSVRAVGATRDAAVAALQDDIAAHVSAGRLVFVDPVRTGLAALAGRYAKDETSREMWQELVTEAYRQRDEEKAREFPE